jgi:hypothetical protein
MSGLRIGIVMMFLVAALVGCSDANAPTEVSALVADHFAGYEGIEPGDPVAGGDLRLYVGDTVVFEAVLDHTGSARITPEPGSYNVQVSLDGAEPGCFWGETLFDVAFPSAPLVVEVAYICAGQ